MAPHLNEVQAKQVKGCALRDEFWLNVVFNQSRQTSRAIPRRQRSERMLFLPPRGTTPLPMHPGARWFREASQSHILCPRGALAPHMAPQSRRLEWLAGGNRACAAQEQDDGRQHNGCSRTSIGVSTRACGSRTVIDFSAQKCHCCEPDRLQISSSRTPSGARD